MKSHVFRLSPVQARALDKRLNNRILTAEDLRLLASIRNQLDGIIDALETERLTR